MSYQIAEYHGTKEWCGYCGDLNTIREADWIITNDRGYFEEAACDDHIDAAAESLGIDMKDFKRG